MPLRSSDVGRKLSDVLKRSEFSTTRINAIRRTSIANGPGGKVALQMDIPRGENRSSMFFLSPLGRPGVDAACLSLLVYLERGFEWPRSGAGTKMGWGLWGGDDPGALSGGVYPNQQGGWSVRNVNTDWGFRLYSYHLNRSGRFGDQGRPVARFNSSDWGTGRWHKIEVEVVMNDPGRNNGYAQVWLDGKHRQTMTNLRFRNSGDWAIRGLLFNDMWGGNTSNPDQFSPKAQKMWYADYKLYTKNGSAVAQNTSTPSTTSESTVTGSAASGGSGFGAISPSGPTDRNDVVLRWRPHPNAERYYLRVNDRRNGSMIVGTTVWPDRACNSTECTHRLSSLPAGQLEWMVRPQDGNRHLAGYSSLQIDTETRASQNTSAPSSTDTTTSTDTASSQPTTTSDGSEFDTVRLINPRGHIGWAPSSTDTTTLTDTASSQPSTTSDGSGFGTVRPINPRGHIDLMPSFPLQPSAEPFSLLSRIDGTAR